jgi:BirA family biotin operon repressor/biotin-[acetyl-CoA-carboxylase] ligase
LIDPEIIELFIKEHKLFGKLIYFDKLGSTNTYAKEIKDEENSVVLTSFQNAGKGRLGRVWKSAANKNLTFSIRQKLDILPSENQYVIFFISYVIFVSIKEALIESGVSSPEKKLQIKWPNDILWESKKLAGILVESNLRSKVYIIGAGLNVNQTDFEKDLDAISLRLISGKEFDLNLLFKNILMNFEKNFDLLNNSKKTTLYNLWLGSTRMIGKKCKFMLNESISKYGLINSLGEDGSITLNIDGELATFFSGDLKIIEYG